MLNQSHTPSATHRYTANTHTQLPVLENHKYPSPQIFGQSQISNNFFFFSTNNNINVNQVEFLNKNIYAEVLGNQVANPKE